MQNLSVKKVSHQISHADQLLLDSIENFRLQTVEFNHENHLRLAYCYLLEKGFKNGSAKMQKTLRNYLKFKGVGQQKYHHTLTHAWLLVVWHVMQQCPPQASSQAFLLNHKLLLNKDLLLTHYSHERLHSATARQRFVQPDLSPFTDLI